MASIKTLIIGIAPPPLGGISIHIKRKLQRLRSGDCDAKLWDIMVRSRGASKISYIFHFMKYLVAYSPTEIEFHVLPMRRIPIEFISIAFYVLLFRKTRFVLVEHSDRFYYGRSKLSLLLLRFFMRFVDHQILVGDNVHKAFREHDLLIKSYSIASPYIEPDYSEEESLLSEYSESVLSFVRRASPCVIVNASKFTRWRGEDVYGLDLAVKSFEKLNQHYTGAGLLIAVSAIDDAEYYKEFVKKITKKNSSIYLMIACKQELWPLFRRADLTLRTTRYDTFGISVQESLDVGTPCIASDVCKRPEGTVLFRAGDSDDLYQQMKATLGDW